MNHDISEALSGWEFEPGSITVRIITGDDQQPKIQMRLELGVIQMEMTGRPDGERPHGFDSSLQYYQQKLRGHREQARSDAGFTLSPDDCEELRKESLYYYYRYLSLFHLNHFEQVAEDTERNLACANFLRTYAEKDEDRYSVDKYRPYILMMNTQARARLAWKDGRHSDALGIVRSGIRKIQKYLQENLSDLADSDEEKEKDEEECHEVRLLQQLEEEITKDLPGGSVDKLRAELERAVQREEFEKAASLRDLLQRLEGTEENASGSAGGPKGG
jgi:hypothetical protein